MLLHVQGPAPLLEKLKLASQSYSEKHTRLALLGKSQRRFALQFQTECVAMLVLFLSAARRVWQHTENNSDTLVCPCHVVGIADDTWTAQACHDASAVTTRGIVARDAQRAVVICFSCDLAFAVFLALGIASMSHRSHLLNELHAFQVVVVRHRVLGHGSVFGRLSAGCEFPALHP